jgi:hypothetical protein
MAALVKRNWNWNQGTDLALYFVYKVGETAATAAPPEDFPLWSIRMVIKSDKDTVATINSESAPDDTHTEAILGIDGSINIVLGRELTLTETLANKVKSKSTKLTYDIILRNADGSRQIKLAEGEITLDPTITLWA